MKHASAVFRALAVPPRHHILQQLKEGELSAGEIADFFTISGPSISRHLSILKNAELIIERHDGNLILYQLQPDRLASAVGDFLSTVCPTQILRRRNPRRKRTS